MTLFAWLPECATWRSEVDLCDEGERQDEAGYEMRVRVIVLSHSVVHHLVQGEFNLIWLSYLLETNEEES